MLKKSFVSAPSDAENGFFRQNLPFQYSLPDNGINKTTGLIVYIGGYGSEYDDLYTSKLLGYFSDKYDCISASVKYFGSDLYGLAEVVPASDFFVNLKKTTGVTVKASASASPASLLSDTLEMLSTSGVNELDLSCRAILKSDDYNSFGVIPALDHLVVVWHLLKMFKPNSSRLFVIGTSCGGHIASMMLKFAPNTFSMIVENSGFTSAADHLSGIYGVFREKICGINIVGFAQHRWKKRPGPFFFSDSHRRIRSLLEKEHISRSNTELYSFHWQGDNVASINRKVKLVKLYAGKVSYHQKVITNDMLDGMEFKTPEHGMRASMRKIFSRSYLHYTKYSKDPKKLTDFELNSKISLDCGDLIYRILFSVETGVELKVIGQKSDIPPATD